MIIMLTDDVVRVVLMELYGFSLEKRFPFFSHRIQLELDR